MATTITTPPRRHESLKQKPRSTKNTIHQASMPNKSIPTPSYELNSTKSLSPSKMMNSSPTSSTQLSTAIDNVNMIHSLTQSSIVPKPAITILPTRSSSLTNPVTIISNSPCYRSPSSPLHTILEPTTFSRNRDSNTPATSSQCQVDISFPGDSDDDDKHSEKVDNDIETAMLHWKRQSTLTLSKPIFNYLNTDVEEAQLNYAFFTENTELWSPSSIFGDIEAILKKPSFQDSCQQAADQLWMEDETLVRRKDMAAFLGKSKLFHHTVLQLYLEKFDFTSQHLEQAFRCVCSKLYFKAEAQEIDRILEAFAYRYWYCNKHSKLLYNADIVYAVVYSMLLLNTDLHIVHGSNHHRMSRSSFCSNTIATILNNIISGDEQQQRRTGDISIWTHDMEVYLKETYTSVKLQGILQPGNKNQSGQHHQQQQKESGVTTTTKSLFQRMGSLKHASSPRRKTSVETGAMIEQRKSYSHVEQMPELEGRIRYRTNGDTRRRNTKSSPTSYDWHEAWLTLHHQGYLRLEKQQIASSRLIRQANQHSSWELDLGYSWVAREAPILLRHNHNRYHSPGSLLATFHLVLGNGIWYEIECEDQDKVDIWVSRIQFRAAMVTNITFMKPPISSDMYGWEANLMEQYDQLDSCTISTWEPHQPSTTTRISSSSSSSSSSSASSSSSEPSVLYSSASSEISIINYQQTGIQQHLITLREEHQFHSTLFSPISKIPTIYHTQKAQILTNWHEKNNYLIQEMEKYELYDKALQNHKASSISPLLPSPSSRTYSDPLSLLALDDRDYSFDLFDEISHSLKHVSLE